MTGAVMLYVTTPDEETAVAIATGLVEGRLAACANVLPGMRSVYRWQGRVEQGHEAVLIIKTTVAKASEAVDRIRDLHPYTLPCVVELPIQGGHQPFLDWIGAEVSD